MNGSLLQEQGVDRHEMNL